MRIFSAVAAGYVLGSLAVLSFLEVRALERVAENGLSPAIEVTAAVVYAKDLEERLTPQPLVPSVIYIPEIDVEASVEAVGKNQAGNMSVPSSYESVAWYREGSMPGEAGSAVIAGHLDNSRGVDAVFADLSELSEGDVIYLEDNSGNTKKFIVDDRAVYDYDFAPVGELFRTEGPSVLRLITCEGAWNEVRRSYQERLVITAVPADS